jgi:hypothetical protein
MLANQAIAVVAPLILADSSLSPRGMIGVVGRGDGI